MEKINEIKLPEGVDRIAVKQYDDKIVIELIPEKPKFKRGDILKSTITPELTVIFDKMTSTTTFDSIYHNDLRSRYCWTLKFFRHATKEEKQEFFDELKADGKRWNAEKLIVEDIPQPKFKIGDKVRFKKGGFIGTNKYDELALTVSGYCNQDQNILVCKGFSHFFHEDWFEPYVEELKKGDLAIFWDGSISCAAVKFYGRKGSNKHYDTSDIPWINAIKFESKEQFEKVLRGEI